MTKTPDTLEGVFAELMAHYRAPATAEEVMGSFAGPEYCEIARALSDLHRWRQANAINLADQPQRFDNDAIVDCERLRKNWVELKGEGVQYLLREDVVRALGSIMCELRLRYYADQIAAFQQLLEETPNLEVGSALIGAPVDWQAQLSADDVELYLPKRRRQATAKPTCDCESRDGERARALLVALKARLGGEASSAEQADDVLSSPHQMLLGVLKDKLDQLIRAINQTSFEHRPLDREGHAALERFRAEMVNLMGQGHREIKRSTAFGILARLMTESQVRQREAQADMARLRALDEDGIKEAIDAAVTALLPAPPAEEAGT